jgi:hypothetical protein
MDNEMYDYAYAQVNELPYAFFDNHFKHKTNIRSDWNIERINYYNECWNKMKEKRQNICFVLFSDCLKMEEDNFSVMLRNRFLGCKIVYFFQDLVKKDFRKQIFLKERRDLVDLIYTFDNNDAKEYNLLFHNIPYSYFKIEDDIPVQNDVVFVGQAKDRLDEIYRCFFEIKKQGLKTEFYIVGAVETEKIKEKKGLNYVEWMPYFEYLKKINKSKCVLEILQGGGSGNTIRVPEAIAFNKFLLSNNKYLVSNKLYNKKYMRVFTEISRVDIKSFINIDVEYNKPKNITPCRFLEDIEKDLCELRG